MLIAVSGDGAGGGWLAPVTADGEAAGPVRRVDDLAAAVADHEAARAVRWLWASTAAVYPPLLRAGVRVARCHDLELTEALLLGWAGQWGAPRSVAAVLARRSGAPAPPDPPPPPAQPPGATVPDTLFDPTPPAPPVSVPDLVTAYRDQCARIAATGAPGRFRLLVAAESAGALTAAEMSHHGLPWRADVHDAILTDLFGRTLAGRRAAAPARRVGGPDRGGARHPWAAPGVARRAAPGLRSRRGRASRHPRLVAARVDHPAVPLLLEYKELYRIWTAHGWGWCEAWVRDGRFRPEWVPAGVVSGRWATRGGGALQIRGWCAAP